MNTQARIIKLEREMAKARMSAGGGDKKSGMSKQTDPINGKGTSRDKAADTVIHIRHIDMTIQNKDGDE